MTETRRQLFVERQTYRRRRIQDAARFLPVLGIVLVLVPLLWSEGEDGVSMSNAIRYLFTLWAALVGAALVLSFNLRVGPGGEADEAAPPPPEDPPEPGP